MFAAGSETKKKAYFWKILVKLWFACRARMTFVITGTSLHTLPDRGFNVY